MTKDVVAKDQSSQTNPWTSFTTVAWWVAMATRVKQNETSGLIWVKFC